MARRLCAATTSRTWSWLVRMASGSCSRAPRGGPARAHEPGRRIERRAGLRRRKHWSAVSIETPAGAAVSAHAEDPPRELACRIGRNGDAHICTGRITLAVAIRIDLTAPGGVADLPRTRAGKRIFAGDGFDVSSHASGRLTRVPAVAASSSALDLGDKPDPCNQSKAKAHS